MAAPQAQRNLHAPYPPTTAALGGVPTKSLDVPIASVFLVLFVGGAVSHMTILQLNRRRGHKFIMSGLLFGFCMARITTMVMRIVWACYPHDVSVAIAAQVFVAAGVVLLFVINLIFSQRILRAAHPNFGWHRALSVAFKILYVLIVIMLIMVITATVYSFYTLDLHRRKQMRDMQLAAATYYMTISFLPIPMVILGLIVPRKTRVEKFGKGRWRHKIAILLTSSILLCLGATFRTATSFKNPRPINHPAPYQSKACFWVFDPGVEVIVVWLYVLVRVDRRFWIPNGSKGPGWYSGAVQKAEGADVNANTNANANGENCEKSGDRRRDADGMSSESEREGREGREATTTRIMSEEEVFDDQVPPRQEEEREAAGPKDVEAAAAAVAAERTA